MLFSICMLAVTAGFSQDDQYYNGDEATVVVKATIAPPALPDYVQPACPADGYIWTPGYWAWGGRGYYWVAGVWVMPPSVGLLWTPGYWGFYQGYYGFHRGYWGDHIGYYGGVNYGFGYYGTGFYGGRWEGGHFRYNAAVWHVDERIHNVYREEGHNIVVNHASYNGPGGVRYHPEAHEISTIHENHIQPSHQQMSHEHMMSNERGQFHNNNERPATHAMSQPHGERFDHEGHSMGNSAPHGGGGHPSGGGGHPSGGGGGHNGGHNGGGHGGGRR